VTPWLAASSTTSKGSPYTSLIFFALIAVVFWLLIIRPQRRRQQQAQQTRRNLEVGAEVQTTFGMLATVRRIEGDTVILEISPGVHARFLSAVVARVIPPPAADSADADPAVAPEADANGSAPGSADFTGGALEESTGADGAPLPRQGPPEA
jgi:preprotein translocase subunit YajC